MLSFMLTIMSIVLMGAMGLTYVNYINPASIVKHKNTNIIVAGFEKLDGSWNQYATANEVYSWVCSTHTTSEGTYEDCQREKTDNGYLPVGNWSSTLFPDYGYLPRSPDNSSWSYGVNASGRYFCLEGDALTPVQMDAVESSQKLFAVNQFVISDTCGDTSDSDISLLTGSTIRATYWLHKY